jgi:hypothetical protein
MSADSLSKDSLGSKLTVADSTNKNPDPIWPYDGSAPQGSNPFLLDLIKRLNEDYTTTLDYNAGLLYVMWPDDLGWMMQPQYKFFERPDHVVNEMFDLGEGQFLNNNFDILRSNVKNVPLRFYDKDVFLCPEEDMVEEGYYFYPVTDSLILSNGYEYSFQISGEEPPQEELAKVKNLESKIFSAVKVVYSLRDKTYKLVLYLSSDSGSYKILAISDVRCF